MLPQRLLTVEKQQENPCQATEI